MIKFKLLSPQAQLPSRKNPADAGMDLHIPSAVSIPPGERVLIDLEIASEFPKDYFCMIKDRSSLGAKGLHVLAGVVDPTYRGSWKVVMLNTSSEPHYFLTGDRIAQAVLLHLPWFTIVQTDELAETNRGTQGFGSTGK